MPWTHAAASIVDPAGEPPARNAPNEEIPMPTRVAINGFGRIGRAVMRSAIERDALAERVLAPEPVAT